MKHHTYVGSIVLLCSACGGTTLTQTGEHFPSREANCRIRVFTTPPAGGYAELGTIDVQPGMYGANSYTDMSSFEEEIRPYVCQAGGDAAVAYVNGAGQYIKASVLRAVSDAGQREVPAPKRASSAPQQGCQYDTQCKGDRICVNGACVAPDSAKRAE